MRYQAKQRIERVAIFGSADLEQTDLVCKQAQEAARALAKKGYIIVNGGGPGVMEAATKGAAEASGQSLTVTFEPKDAPHFEGNSNNNIGTSTMKGENYLQRVGMLIENADFFVIFKGGTGTLSEWGLVWLLAHIYRGHHKPFVLFGDFWYEVLEVIQKHFLIGDIEMSVFKVVNNVEEMLTAMDDLMKEVKGV